VILSGTATDGTLGLDEIKADGRITFAQDESARDNSMPRSALLGLRSLAGNIASALRRRGSQARSRSEARPRARF
jgi:chemotaxis response regulator CheB